MPGGLIFCLSRFIVQKKITLPGGKYVQLADEIFFRRYGH